jgi:hypothetical protein
MVQELLREAEDGRKLNNIEMQFIKDHVKEFRNGFNL